MNLAELINITNKLYYADSSSWRVIESKQKELLSIISANIQINKINYKVINHYVEKLKKNNNSNSTINSKLSYLSKILKYAYQNGLIEYTPTLPYLKVKNQKEKYLTNLELIQILNWTRQNRQKQLQQIILIGLYTGLRINNILTITKELIVDNKLYLYDKKTNRNFILPISNKIKYILNNFKGFTINYQQTYYIFNQMKQELQLDTSITIHTLRHTFCSRLVQKNVPLLIIQKLANHSSIQTTATRYAHLSIKELQSAIDVL